MTVTTWWQLPFNSVGRNFNGGIKIDQQLYNFKGYYLEDTIVNIHYNVKEF